MKINKVTVFGSGHLGSQLTFLIAFQKFDVTIYDLDLGLLEEARTKFRELGDQFRDHYNATQEEIDAALANLAYSADITEASGNADIVIEAIPDERDIKKEFFTKLGKVAPKNTIFVTSSSHLLPEDFAKETGRPEKFLGVHFPDELWKKNSAEIIEHKKTDPAVTATVAGFIEDIGLVIAS
ncbi:3-hydroxyacyl-CoA dehydrogenase NAD-binding domain-containing protein [Antarcticibacterium sp. 1MA-6-2]|uniref:3-hydroxyacyl-CoA dehydrogenase NAD-binding domain-containing protein n=1 Tax=Antarcticibacterium sp. 1MA-6-2 TaxID=2908210 RepID=UPI001F319F3A|nr:3-hydroxyacyl-CoA dehydrogenase NAD-binding domain-containing protein [Antarcticibacterium sp. 1MA-6-2]UJH91599.1 3-hydroxyacyl-CoA dehydrogenase NAD-binding domain-containing protein [Antarcticibacterium sp. 1MA-6-2]